jgi:hypothetical protein
MCDFIFNGSKIGPFELTDYVKNHFKDDLNTILNDEDALSEICNRSTVHSNGFLKIVLKSYNGQKLRLHIWKDSPLLQEHEPHSHRWDFVSYILKGVMINEIVEESNDENKTFLKCKAHGMIVGSKRDYDIISKSSLRLNKKEIFKQGEVYTLSGDKIHIAKISPHTLTATLFVTSEPLYETSFVYMPDLTSPPSGLVLESLSIEELKKQITNVISWI